MQFQPSFSMYRSLFSYRVGIILALTALGGVPALSVGAQTYDANADYNTSLVTGTNPNGVWTYGWSTSPTAALNLYPNHHIITVGPTVNAWNDPSHLFGNVPLVYKNTGPDYTDSNVTIPANALILHGGGPGPGGTYVNNFSNVVFTAPSNGDYSLTSTFELRQQNVSPASVQVLENGVSLFDDTLSTFLSTASYSNSFQLHAGDTLDFAVGFAGTPANGSGNSVELSATLTDTPEPGACALLVGCASAFLVGLRRRRK